ncbi:MAG: branched-chain amino acid aminotransferase [Oligoflexia bacterium]|nr:branched-chain amino acid aminotransferase [Oligoflexia bacterium]
MDIIKCEKKPKAQYPLHPRFGTIFAPHMLRMNFTADDLNNLKPEIVPFEQEYFSPATIAFHYGQSIFEGLKAYQIKGGGVASFRADLHAARFMKSSARMAMPVIGEKVFLDCLREYVRFENESVPHEPDHSLYLRPLLFGRDEVIKVGRSKTYSFYILATMAGSYFHGGSAKPARVLVNRQFVRAFPGGLGEIKTAANYASSLGPQSYAETHQCDQVLYLDALKHEFIDELGGMNFFMIRDGELVTPSLTGTILNGVTRRSILEIAPGLGLTIREEPISFTQMLKDILSGRVTETFACGTAAVVHTIGELVVQDSIEQKPEVIKLPDAHPIGDKILTTLKAMQRGEIKAPGDWLFQ